MGAFVFLHIEKTAGTSISKSVLEPNVSCEKIGSFRSVLHDARHPRPAVCYHGHVAYGIHHLLRVDPVYVTMLREPVDRAISHYYFIKGLKQTDLYERHRLRDYADSVTVAEFYENRAFANIQTRRLAGVAFDHAYPILSHDRMFLRRMLAAAKRHLDAMPVFGLRERYVESQQRFLNFVGGGVCIEGLVEKRTAGRRSIQEIESVRPTVIERLRRCHQLDAELYAYAVERFDGVGLSVDPPRAVALLSSTR